MLLSGLVKSAAELRGLAFGNSIDRLLPQGGLGPKTLTFVYGRGKGINKMMNILCGNAVQIFGGRSIFIDASNSFDPYTIVRCCTYSKNSASSEKLLQSIVISRAFTCYQLTDLVVGQLAKKLVSSSSSLPPIRFVAVSGISSVFNEQDNTATEKEQLHHLMAAALRKIASDRSNELRFVVASSDERSDPFVQKSDVAIKLFADEKTGREKAVLMKHYAKQFAETDL
jgi:hypothetical protein